MLLAAALPMLGCSSSTAPDAGDLATVCQVSSNLAKTAGPGATDCGHLVHGDPGYTAAALTRAEDCVLGAQDAGLSYLLALDLQLADGGWVPGGFAHQAGLVDGWFAHVEPDSETSCGRGPVLEKDDCFSVFEDAGCSDAVGHPCLRCMGGDIIDGIDCACPPPL